MYKNVYSTLQRSFTRKIVFMKALALILFLFSSTFETANIQYLLIKGVSWLASWGVPVLLILLTGFFYYIKKDRLARLAFSLLLSLSVVSVFSRTTIELKKLRPKPLSTSYKEIAKELKTPTPVVCVYSDYVHKYTCPGSEGKECEWVDRKELNQCREKEAKWKLVNTAFDNKIKKEQNKRKAQNKAMLEKSIWSFIDEAFFSEYFFLLLLGISTPVFSTYLSKYLIQCLSKEDYESLYNSLLQEVQEGRGIIDRLRDQNSRLYQEKLEAQTELKKERLLHREALKLAEGTPPGGALEGGDRGGAPVKNLYAAMYYSLYAISQGTSLDYDTAMQASGYSRSQVYKIYRAELRKLQKSKVIYTKFKKS